MADSIGTSSSVLSLPQSGASSTGLGEVFNADLYRGTSNLSVPIQLPPGVNGVGPDLSLSYTSGNGNGIFGQGFILDTLMITRSTRHGFPKYTDEDTFLLGAEDLVPVSVSRYRPRIESSNWLIEKVDNGWSITTQDGTIYRLGGNHESTVVDDSTGKQREYAWLLREVEDSNGEKISYHYQTDGAQRYLKEIRYAVFNIVFHYQKRMDSLCSRRSGFELFTRLRVSSIDIVSQRAVARSLRTYTFEYDNPGPKYVSLLSRITLHGGDSRTDECMPPMMLNYTKLELAERNYLNCRVEGEAMPPPPLGPDVNFVDLAGDGLPDAVTVTRQGFLVWKNLGQGLWKKPLLMTSLPGGQRLSDKQVQFADLEGNGTCDLLIADPVSPGYFPNLAEGSWDNFVGYDRPLPFSMDDPNLRLVDLDGDGRVDAILSTANAFLIYLNEGSSGWASSAIRVRRRHDLAEWPDVDFSDERILFSDMTGDGLNDIVMVDDRSIHYWPNLGYGNFGRRVIFRNAPVLPRNFNRKRFYLVDIDGDGFSDVVYVDDRRVSIWINSGGEDFSAPIEMNNIPALDAANVLLIDLLGTGSPGLLISFPGAASTGYRFISLVGEQLPYFLSSVDNGLGATTKIRYSPVEKYRNSVRSTGDWKSFLPFSLRVVDSVEVHDRVSGIVSSAKYRYGNGHYDGMEREFRGFEDVIEIELGDESTPTIERHHQFNVGADLNLTEAQRRRLPQIDQFRGRALSGRAITLSLYVDEAAGFREKERTSYKWLIRDEYRQADVLVNSCLMVEMEERTLEVEGDRIIRESDIQYDNQGNQTKLVLSAGREIEGFFVPEVELTEQLTFADRQHPSQRWSLRAICEKKISSIDNGIAKLERTYYDGDSYIGLPLGQLGTGKISRVEELVFSTVAIVGTDLENLDFEALGYHQNSEGVFRNTGRFKYGDRGLTVGLRDPIGNEQTIEYEPAGIHAVKVTNALNHTTVASVNYAVEALGKIDNPSGLCERQEYDSLGRVVGLYRVDETGDEYPYRLLQYNNPSYTGGIFEPASIVSLTPREKMAAASIAAHWDSDPDTLDARVIKRVSYIGGMGSDWEIRASAENDKSGNSRAVASGLRSLNGRAEVKSSSSVRGVDSFSYDSDASLAPSDREFKFKFDYRGRVVRSTEPQGRSRVTEYCAWWSKAWEEGSTLPDLPQRVEHYDALSRIVSIEETIDADKFSTTHYRYNSNGHLIDIETDGHKVFKQMVDLGGRPWVSEQSDTGVRMQIYNTAGKVVESRGAGSVILKNYYDEANRVVRVTENEGVIEKTLRQFVYDSNPINPMAKFLKGRLARVSDESGELEYSYNIQGGVESVKRQHSDASTMELKTEFDWLGNVAVMEYPNGRRISYGYNASNLLDSIGGIVNKIHYTIDGQAEELHYSTGLVSHYGFDQNRRPSSIRLTDIHDNALSTIDYEYTSLGNVSKITEAGESWRREKVYEYDKLNQLTQYSRDNGRALETEYDLIGNIKLKSDVGSSPFEYADPLKPHKLTSFTSALGRTTLDYDNQGRVSHRDDIGSFHYDSLGRMSRLLRTDGTEITIKHGYGDQRVEKVVRSNDGRVRKTTRYMTDLFEEYDDSSVKMTVIANGSLIASINTDARGAEKIKLYHSDLIGNVRLTSDDTGSIDQYQQYDPWGKAHDESSPQLFIGREYDEDLKLVRLGNRLYDPQLGRFMTPDEVAVSRPEKFLNSPLQLNPYSYSVNNPVRYRDPSGRWAMLAGAVIGAVIGYLAAKENGGNPWVGALIGAFVGAFFGAAGLLKGALYGAGMAAAANVLSNGGRPGENFWTSVAVGFVFGGVSSAIPTPTVSGSGAWVNTQNIMIEVGKEALISGVQGGVVAELSGEDFWAGFAAGALAGAVTTGAKIAVFGVRYDAAAGPDPTKDGIGSQIDKEFTRQSKFDNSNLAQKIEAKGMPQLQGVTFRRHGILQRINGGRSFVFSNNVNMANGDHYNAEVLAHEVRHIAQQQFFDTGFVGFLTEYGSQYFSDAWGYSYQDSPKNTTYEVHY